MKNLASGVRQGEVSRKQPKYCALSLSLLSMLSMSMWSYLSVYLSSPGAEAARATRRHRTNRYPDIFELTAVRLTETADLYIPTGYLTHLLSVCGVVTSLFSLFFSTASRGRREEVHAARDWHWTKDAGGHARAFVVPYSPYSGRKKLRNFLFQRSCGLIFAEENVHFWS